MTSSPAYAFVFLILGDSHGNADRNALRLAAIQPRKAPT
jgi:hypothetical protein